MVLNGRLRLAILACALAAGVAGAAAWWWLRPAPWRDATSPPPPLAAALDAFARGALDEGLRETRRALDDYRAPVWTTRARVAAAARAAEARRNAEVLVFLPGPLAADDPLAAHVDLLRARAALSAGRFAEAGEAAARAAGVAGFPHRDEALRTRAAALSAAGDRRAAAEALASSDDPDLAIEGARLAAEAGDLAGARRRLAATALKTPPGDAAERALEALQTLVADPLSRFDPGERASLPAKAGEWIEARRPAGALALLRSAVIAGAPAAARDPAAALAEAEALVRLGRPGEAQPFLLRARAGDGATRDGARYWAARAESQRGRRSAYVAGLRELARRPGRSPWKLQSLADLAEIADGTPQASALAAYERYRAAAGESADPVAMFREGFIAHELGRAREAEAAFARVLARDGAPLGARVAALYWAGRRREAAGRRAEAERLYAEILERGPGHYYAGPAERRLRRATPPAAPDAVPAADAVAAGPAARWIEAARALRSVSLTSWVWPSYRAAIEVSPPGAVRAIALEAAAAALDAGAPAEALAFVQRGVGDRETVSPDVLPRRLWRLLLPAPSGPAIADAARAQGLEPAFVASIVLEESGFNPLAVSPVGARGLLQLMPSTGAEVARRVGLRGFHPDRLFEPAVSLRLGTTYLRALRDRLGSPPAVLAAYNAGPARAERWRLPKDGADGEEFVERIPIPATRIYVKRILANARLYRVAWPAGLDAQEAR